MRTELINAYATISNEAENLLFHGLKIKYQNAVNARDSLWGILTQEEKDRLTKLTKEQS